MSKTERSSVFNEEHIINIFDIVVEKRVSKFSKRALTREVYSPYPELNRLVLGPKKILSGLYTIRSYFVLSLAFLNKNERIEHDILNCEIDPEYHKSLLK